MTWRESAACAGMHGNLFFPTGTPGKPFAEDVRLHRQTAAVKAVCAGCPVAAPCLLEALERCDGWGVFGGLTAEERATPLRRERRPSSTPRIRHVRVGAG
jgi:WhiB family redox-sensing transcriptional regulator